MPFCLELSYPWVWHQQSPVCSWRPQRPIRCEWKCSPVMARNISEMQGGSWRLGTSENHLHLFDSLQKVFWGARRSHAATHISSFSDPCDSWAICSELLNCDVCDTLPEAVLLKGKILESPIFMLPPFQQCWFCPGIILQSNSQLLSYVLAEAMLLKG